MYFTLPTNWIASVTASAGGFAGDFMPVVLWIVGISVALLVIRVLAGLAR